MAGRCTVRRAASIPLACQVAVVCIARPGYSPCRISVVSDDREIRVAVRRGALEIAYVEAIPRPLLFTSLVAGIQMSKAEATEIEEQFKSDWWETNEKHLTSTSSDKAGARCLAESTECLKAMAVCPAVHPPEPAARRERAREWRPLSPIHTGGSLRNGGPLKTVIELRDESSSNEGVQRDVLAGGEFVRLRAETVRQCHLNRHGPGIIAAKSRGSKTSTLRARAGARWQTL